MIWVEVSMRRGERCSLFLLLAILWALVAPQAGQAQILYGSIVGNVRDASDAVVVGARVVIVHSETKQSREETTNVMGGYSLSLIHISEPTRPY